MSRTPKARKLRHPTLVDRIGSFGGGERLAAEISKRLSPERFDRILCATRWGPEVESRPTRAKAVDDLSEHGVRFVGLTADTPWACGRGDELLLLMRRERIDILHAHKFGSNLWAALLGPRAGVPVIVAHEHTWSFEGGAQRRFIDRQVIARRCDMVVAVSREDRRRLVELEGLPPERVVYIPNGIPAPPPPTGAVQRAGLGLHEDDLVVGAVGVLRPQEGAGRPGQSGRDPARGVLPACASSWSAPGPSTGRSRS